MTRGTPARPTAVLAALAGVAAIALAPHAIGAVGTILLVVNNSTSLDSQESARQTLFQGWGYTVVPISATSTQGAFDAACLTSSMAYISETVLSSDVSTKLTNTTIPIVCEESVLSDALGFSTSMTTFTDSQINITNNTHYITSTFSLGTLSLFSAGQPVRYLSGTQGGYTSLGAQVSTSNVTLAIMERGDTLTPTGTAAGRRVYLPWGNTGMNINQLNSGGTTMLKRSIEWSLLPVSHWKCDEGSGSVVSDWIGGRNGTRSGASWTTGKLAGGLQYNGATDYVSVPDHAAFHVTNAMTITGWVRGTTWPSDPDWACTILRKGEANPNNWELCIGLGKVSLVLDDYDAYAIRGNTTLPLNTWCHAAATWDGSKVRLYLNGVPDNTPYTRAAPIGTDTRDVYLGGRTESTDVLPGRVDDVRFYNRCLTAAEIAAMAKTSPAVMTWQEVSPP